MCLKEPLTTNESGHEINSNLKGVFAINSRGSSRVGRETQLSQIEIQLIWDSSYTLFYFLRTLPLT